MNLDNIDANIIDNFLSDDEFKFAQNVFSKITLENDYSNFDGKRSSLKNRYFVTKKSPNSHKSLVNNILKKFNTKYRVRVEFCKDANGYWLKPHNDHPERKHTLLIYIDGNGPGTTFYNKNDKKTIEFKKNRALFFSTIGLNTYDISQISHGVEKQVIDTYRSTIILTFVNDNFKNIGTCYDI